MRFFKHLFKKQELFEISGYEDVKWILEKGINNEDPIHILIVGPPGLGKTLKATEKEYPDLSYFALASGSTGADMINHCFDFC